MAKAMGPDIVTPNSETSQAAVSGSLGMDGAFAIGYDPWLVAASVAIAVMASFTGLRLASGLQDLQGDARRWQIAKAAVTLGGGIWSMHFVGMLAVRLPVLVTYDALYTLGSVLISILIVGLGLSLMHLGVRNWPRTIFAGTATGLGIVSMHYVGMDAIGGDCVTFYRSGGLPLSSAIAIGFSIFALRLAYGRRTLVQLCLGGLVLGVTIAAMHYSAMAFTLFLPVAGIPDLASPAIDQGQLALIVALAAFLVCGLFLLTALPLDRAAGEGGPDLPAGKGPAGMSASGPGLAFALAGGTLAGGTLAGGTLAGGTLASGTQAGGTQAGAAPVAEAGLPATASPAAGIQGRSPTMPDEATERIRLPYEQNNATLLIDASRVQAIQADGHYSRLIDGSGVHFCPWSLSRVEAHLAGLPFIRTHRSFLVNLDHASGLRRDRDKTFLMLPAMTDEPVPVSRSHLAEVRRALGLQG